MLNSAGVCAGSRDANASVMLTCAELFAAMMPFIEPCAALSDGDANVVHVKLMLVCAELCVALSDAKASVR